MSLRAKFLLAFALVALLGVGVVSLVANRVTTREFTLYAGQGRVGRAQVLVSDVAAYYEKTGSWRGVEDLLENALLDHGPGQGRGQGSRRGGDLSDRGLVVDASGRVVADTEGGLVGQAMQGNYQEWGAPVVVGGQTIATLVITTQDLSGHSEMEEQFLQSVNRSLFWAGLLVAIVAVGAAFLLSRQLVGPLRQLSAAAEAMAGGDLAQRVQVRTRDEVGELGRAFNGMANDLQSAEMQRQQMTADIAHELRNPLSIIRGNLEAMLDGIYAPDAEHLGPIHEETLLLQRLVEDLRLLSLADAGQLRLVQTEVDVCDLLVAVAESARAVADDEGVSLHVDVPAEPVVILADADRLRQVIGNLVSNALRYTPAGGSASLLARCSGDRVQVAVSDSGQGIAAEDLPHVFDRFYRADAARDRASGGSGANRGRGRRSRLCYSDYICHCERSKAIPRRSRRLLRRKKRSSQ
jgi:signal transduction histidine kinase